MEDRIKQAARKLFGDGKQASAFIQGGLHALTLQPTLNMLSARSYASAVNRGKTSSVCTHNDTFWGIFEELKEFREAYENTPSEHLPDYSQAQEELADILICCLTELHRRGVDIDKLILDKIQYNEER